MDKNVLNQINSIREEIKELKGKIDKIDKKPTQIVIDSVRGSSASYPYIQHNCTVEDVIDIISNSHDIIEDIINRYFKGRI